MKDHGLNLAVVIMAGGTGTRFWPLSTGEMPKQFLCLFGEKSLLRMSYERISGLVPPERVLVLTGAAYEGIVKKQLPEIPEANVIGEPERRDTAAAVALAGAILGRRFGNPVIATLTSDHIIEPVHKFQADLLSAAREAERGGSIYTFGVRPAYPATGYGYLKLGARVLTDGTVDHYEVLGFKEKPGLETARQYLESGDYLWNSGMFVWTASAIIGEIKRHLPEHASSLIPLAALEGSPEWPAKLREAFSHLPKVSIDFGVMEKAGRTRCVEASFRWRDVGGWSAMASHLPKNPDGNACRGIINSLDSTDNLVFCEDPSETVVLIGVSGLVVVRAGDKTLITPKDRAEDLKKVVEEMKGKG